MAKLVALSPCLAEAAISTFSSKPNSRDVLLLGAQRRWLPCFSFLPCSRAMMLVLVYVALRCVVWTRRARLYGTTRFLPEQIEKSNNPTTQMVE
jgi:hypothetical protein